MRTIYDVSASNKHLFAQVLASVIEDSGLSQRAISHLTGIPQPAVSMTLNCKRPPSVNFVSSICAVLAPALASRLACEYCKLISCASFLQYVRINPV